MSKKLTCNIFLRENPPLGEIKHFLAGETLPDWAEEALKDCEHLFTETQEAQPTVQRESKGGPLPEEPEVTVEEHETPHAPGRNASQVAWKRFAESIGVEVPESATRDQIIELVNTSHPEYLESHES